MVPDRAKEPVKMARQHILLIDSDERSLRVMEVSLRQAGHGVSSSSDGELAWEKIRDEQPALIISELDGIGALSGMELCARLQESELTRSIPFIFLTKSSSPENRAQALQAGADDFLSKPVYMGELLSRVKLLLQRQARASLTEGSREQFFGRLEETGMVDLLRIIESSAQSGKSGRLVVEHRGRRGELWFEDGQIVDAESGARRGEEALYRLLTWEKGQFEIHFEPIQRPQKIRSPMERILNEGLRRVDTWARICEQLPDLNTVFRVDSSATRERQGEFAEETNSLLALFDGKRSALDILDESVSNDIDTLSMISQLYFESIIYEVRSRYDQDEPEPLFVEGESVGFTPLPQSALSEDRLPKPEDLDDFNEVFTPETEAQIATPPPPPPPEEAGFPATAGLPPPIQDELLRTPAPEEREVGQDLLQDLYQSAALDLEEVPPPPPPPGALDDDENPLFAEGQFDEDSQDFFERIGEEESDDFSDLIGEERAGISRSMLLTLLLVIGGVGGLAAFFVLRDTVTPLETELDLEQIIRWHSREIRGRDELNLHDFSPEDPIPRLAASWESEVEEETNARPELLPPELTQALQGRGRASRARARGASYSSLLREGDALLAERRVPEAIERYLSALRQKPRSTVAMVKLAEAYTDMQNHDAALAVARKAVQTDAQSKRAYLFIGSAYQGLRRPLEAVSAYESFLRLEPDGALADEIRRVLEGIRREQGEQ